MIIFAASDFHEGVCEQGDHAIALLARYVLQNATQDDVLLLGGDLAQDDETLVRLVRRFEAFPGRRLAVLGNHDVWTTTEGESSWQRYHRGIELLEQEGVHALDRAPCEVGGKGFVGSLGWYDYSFQDLPGVEFASYERKTPPWSDVPVWNDARYACWDRSDPDMVEWLLQHLQEQLDALVRDGVDDVVALVHHVPTKSLLVHPRWLVPARWRFMNAFLGSERFADLLRRYPQVRLIINGHIHLQRKVVEAGRTFVSIGGSYAHKQLLIISPDHTICRQMF